MYCQNCGNTASGNYCTHCGAKLQQDIVPEQTSLPVPWSEEPDFYKLINRQEVRNIIAMSAEGAPKSISATQFLSMLDWAVKPFTGLALFSITEKLVPFYEKLGIGTGKSASKEVAQRVPLVIVKVLCSLAKNGYPVEAVEVASNGLIIWAKVPSDIWTWGGDALITIEGKGDQTQVEIKVKIKGQLYDWGKSKSLIKKVLNDIDGLRLTANT